MANQDTGYITSGHAARILGITEARGRQLADAGKLVIALRLTNGTRVYRLADVEQLAAQRGTRVRARDAGHLTTNDDDKETTTMKPDE